MKISVVTAVYNNRFYLEDTIKSVLSQTHDDVEHIIVDGGSVDGTLKVIKKYTTKISKWISEPDKGIYDAMNKGIGLATGEVICFLNSDDIYSSPEVLRKVNEAFLSFTGQGCYGDVRYRSRDLARVIRYWEAGEMNEKRLSRGWMPPHPAFFLKRELLSRFGSFRTDFHISADYELFLRMIKKAKISIKYIPEILVDMRIGGKSNTGLRNLIMKSIEDHRAWKLNGMRAGMIFFKKPFFKMSQFIKK